MGKRAAATRATQARIIRRSISVKASARLVQGGLRLAVALMTSWKPAALLKEESQPHVRPGQQDSWQGEPEPHHRALVVQKVDTENEAGAGFLGHAQINHPQLCPAGPLHESSSRSYVANIEAEAWIICWYSFNQPASSATSDGCSRSMADSISATVLMRRNLPSGIHQVNAINRPQRAWAGWSPRSSPSSPWCGCSILKVNGTGRLRRASPRGS